MADPPGNWPLALHLGATWAASRCVVTWNALLSSCEKCQDGKNPKWLWRKFSRQETRNSVGEWEDNVCLYDNVDDDDGNVVDDGNVDDDGNVVDDDDDDDDVYPCVSPNSFFQQP